MNLARQYVLNASMEQGKMPALAWCFLLSPVISAVHLLLTYWFTGSFSEGIAQSVMFGLALSLFFLWQLRSRYHVLTVTDDFVESKHPFPKWRFTTRIRQNEVSEIAEENWGGLGERGLALRKPGQFHDQGVFIPSSLADYEQIKARLLSWRPPSRMA